MDASRFTDIGSPRILEYRGAFEGKPYAQMKQAVLEELRYSFRPELRNGIDTAVLQDSAQRRFG